MHFAMQGKKCNRIHRLKDDDDIDQNMFFLKKIREKTHTKNTDNTIVVQSIVLTSKSDLPIPDASI